MVLLNCECPTVEDTLTNIEPIEPVCVECNASSTLTTIEDIESICPPCSSDEPIIDVQFHKSGASETKHTPNNMNFILTLSMSKMCYKV